MKSSIKILVTGFVCVVASIGCRTGVNEETSNSEVISRGRYATIHANENFLYYKLNKADRGEELQRYFLENMWLSIIDLEKLSNDPNAPKDERDVAIRTLKKLIMHFHLHPRKSSYPEKVNIAERVKERLDKTLKDPTRDPEENEVLKMLAEQSKGALGGFDDLMNSLFSAAIIRDMETHAIVDRLIEQRYFPGREYKAGGMTVLSGALAGTHIFRSLEGSKFNFQVTGGSLELDVRYDGNHLIVNGEDFGQLGTNDIVDFRERHLVYVNNIERKPTGPMTTQDSDQPSASAIESKPE